MCMGTLGYEDEEGVSQGRLAGIHTLLVRRTYTFHWYKATSG